MDTSVNPTPTSSGENPTDEGFWKVFALAWVLYSALLVTGSTMEGNEPGTTVTGVFLSVLPQALLGIAIASKRRALFPEDWSLVRTLVLHAGIGLAYAGAVCGVVFLIVPLIADVGSGAEKWTDWPLFQFFNALFFYTLLAGFMGWTESRRRVTEARAIVAREGMLRAQAEAQAVRAQFNPHFVFNTLHSLLLLVRADPPAAERAIEDVAALIRYASRLERESVDAVSLDEEIGFARKYLALEKLRLGERLNVDWAIEEGSEAVSVPAFSLQTLLENAVKHGIAPRTGGGSIHIRSRLVSGYVEIVVEDDGRGAEPADVEATAGQGLLLLRRRMEAEYGDRASLEWSTRPGEGFQVLLRIPRSDGSTEAAAP